MGASTARHSQGLSPWPPGSSFQLSGPSAHMGSELKKTEAHESVQRLLRLLGASPVFVGHMPPGIQKEHAGPFFLSSQARAGTCHRHPPGNRGSRGRGGAVWGTGGIFTSTDSEMRALDSGLVWAPPRSTTLAHP